MKLLSTAFLSASVLLSTAALSQTPTPAQDANFMKTMGAGGIAEVDVGKLAVERATHPEVKKFAQQMVDDHSKGNAKLTALAKQKNVELPAKIEGEHAADKMKLEKERAATFDAEYMKAMVKKHEKTVQLLQTEINTGKDEQVKTFARDTLPTVQHHLKMAKDIEAKVGAGTERTSRSDTH